MKLPEKQNTDRTYRIVDGYVLRCIADEYIAVPVALQGESQSQIAILNESGSYLWERLLQKNTVEDLVTAMTDHFDVSETEAETDILEFIRYLDEHHLLVTEEQK